MVPRKKKKKKRNKQNKGAYNFRLDCTEVAFFFFRRENKKKKKQLDASSVAACEDASQKLY